jgi:L-ribulose-5-phosphate 4-epimerase
MLEKLKELVYEANLELVKQKLVVYTWGNVSGYDYLNKLIVIKPSGVSYDTMRVSDMVVVDLDGNVIEGKLKPSSDTPTHIALYKQYPDLRGIVHTHSEWATSWAQANKSIPVYGTTHCDYFYGQIPCTRKLTQKEIQSNYEYNTGNIIIETIESKKRNPLEIPGVIVAQHGPFAWGKNPKEAVHNAKVLEEVAKMAFNTKLLNKDIEEVSQVLLDKHYLRKHGRKAYYGQE